MRIGPHVQIPARLSVEGAAWLKRAPVVKAIDDPAPLTQAEPGAITVFRAFMPNMIQDVISPAGFLAVVQSRLKGFVPTYIEGLNEHRSKASEGLLNYIQWTTEYVRLAHAAGYKVAGFSFSTGCPEEQDWLLIQHANFCSVDALSLHGYWGPNGIDDWNALRHRRMHQWTGGQHPPVIITEAGRDALDGAEPGWHRQNISAEQYVAELLAYDAELVKDPYVVGATVFTAGAADDWQHFEVDSIASRLPGGLPSQPVKETKMGVAVALLPSNQDRNRSPVIPAYNEAGGMGFMSPLIEERCRARGMNVRVFRPGLESTDTYPLQHLHEQQDAAAVWLKQQPESLKVALNFHTDSGDFSHTYAIYGVTKGGLSRKCAEAIGPHVTKALHTSTYQAFDKLGSNDYSTYVFYQAMPADVAAVLIELCSHVNAEDIRTLYANPGVAAEALATGVAQYAGLTSGIDWQAKAAEWQALYNATNARLTDATARMAAIAKLAAAR